jgi:hypothetical protein
MTFQQLVTAVGNAATALNAAVANEVLVFTNYGKGTATAAQVGAAIIATNNAKAAYDQALTALQNYVTQAIAGGT